MSEAPPVLASPFDAAKFGFALSRAPDGWRWQAFDLLGQVTEEGLASNRAQAAALLIRALARS